MSIKCIKILGSIKDRTEMIRCEEDAMLNSNYCEKHSNKKYCEFVDTNDMGDMLYCISKIPVSLKYCSGHEKFIKESKFEPSLLNKIVGTSFMLLFIAILITFLIVCIKEKI